jgi:HEAT repeat protein
MRMMRKHDPGTQEDGFHFLRPRAAEFTEQLMAEFRREKAHGLRCWLLELIGEARDPRAFDLLIEYLHSPDESLRYWAIIGLQDLNSREARKALFEAGVRRPARS